jgi:glycosyltransferase involved in cell wall biosynthesis
MRILILSSFLPHPEADHAGGIVLWRMIQGLASRHELSVISFVNNEQEIRHSQVLSSYCRQIQTVLHPNVSAATDSNLRVGPRIRGLLFSRLPYDVWRFRSQEMTKAIRQTLAKEPFDIIQAEFIQMGQYIEAFYDHPRTVFRQHDLTFALIRRQVQTTASLRLKLYRYIQWRRMERYELATCRRFRKVILPSRQAKAELLKYLPELNVNVVPFGVSLPKAPEENEPSDEGRILFVGAMGRRFNIEAVVHFYQEVWPHIVKEKPDSEFWIVGSNPSPRVSQLAQEDARIRVTGFVTDLEPFYTQASVFVAPILVGGGVVTRTLNAMAMSKAVVTTSVGNEGIEATPERDLIVADEPHEFAKRVIELMNSREKRRQIGKNGRAFVQRQFGWESIINRLEHIYAEMIDDGTQFA